ncbi:MAG: rRNA maturation RNase YbeY [Akkermansia sp.]|nr:rRNA maturation RNase YbeY [Akkermansia sp.]
MIPQIELYLNTEREWVSEALLERFAEALRALLPELLAQPKGPDHVLSELPVVEIAVVDDEAIAQVHAEFLDDPSETDAITFPYGEILVSCDTAARYAAEHGLLPEEELFRYMVHGLTHLHGYLDYEPADREALFAVQEPLVARFFPK